LTNEWALRGLSKEFCAQLISLTITTSMTVLYTVYSSFHSTVPYKTLLSKLVVVAQNRAKMLTNFHNSLFARLGRKFTIKSPSKITLNVATLKSYRLPILVTERWARS